MDLSIHAREMDYLDDDSNEAAGRGVRTVVMEERECPFVNRADARCSEHLTMGGMGYAFEHCFSKYESCPLHAELMQERSGSLVAARVGGQAEPAVEVRVQQIAQGRLRRLGSRLVQLTVGRRRLGSAA